MLQMRPSCECCDVDLHPAAADVWICSFECTWCSACVDRFPGRRCPNCGGTLTLRPSRAASKLPAAPGSTKRVFNPSCLPVP